MSRLDGRVVIVTGAGRGLGREHAKLLAAHGARVVVNDLGGDVFGHGSDLTAAQAVVDEIRAAGGEAIVSGHDVADWDQAGAMVEQAVSAFGELHALVNNAGILRDRSIVNMTEDEWDAVIRVHLKGHMAPTHHAMRYWHLRSKTGDPVKAPSIVMTSSASGFVGNFGQANYGAAKMGVVALMQIARIEGARFGLRANAVGPNASTRMNGSAPGQVPEVADDFLDPAAVSPVVAWLVEPDCPANGQLFHVYANRVMVLANAFVAADLISGGPMWTVEELASRIPEHLVSPPDLDDFLTAPADLVPSP